MPQSELDKRLDEVEHQLLDASSLEAKRSAFNQFTSQNLGGIGGPSGFSVETVFHVVKVNLLAQAWQVHLTEAQPTIDSLMNEVKASEESLTAFGRK